MAWRTFLCQGEILSGRRSAIRGGREGQGGQNTVSRVATGPISRGRSGVEETSDAVISLGCRPGLTLPASMCLYRHAFLYEPVQRP